MNIYSELSRILYTDITDVKFEMIYDHSFPSPYHKTYMIEFNTKERKYGCIEFSMASDNFIVLNNTKYTYKDILHNDALIYALINNENTKAALEELP